MKVLKGTVKRLVNLFATTTATTKIKVIVIEHGKILLETRNN